MHVRQEVLTEIRNKYIWDKDKTAEVFLFSVWMHYLKIDMETGGRLAEIFKMLYLVEERRPFDEIADMFNISLSTLERHRKRFNNYASKLLLFGA